MSNESHYYQRAFAFYSPMYAALPMHSIAGVAQSGTEIIWEIQLVRVFRDTLN
jgi:hypothetical protein